MPDTVINVLIILVPLVVCLGCGVLYCYFIKLKCPACNKFNALVPTGKFEKARRFLGSTRDEHRCRYCDEVVWKERVTGEGGG